MLVDPTETRDTDRPGPGAEQLCLRWNGRTLSARLLASASILALCLTATPVDIDSPPGHLKWQTALAQSDEDGDNGDDEDDEDDEDDFDDEDDEDDFDDEDDDAGDDETDAATGGADDDDTDEPGSALTISGVIDAVGGTALSPDEEADAVESGFEPLQ